VTGPPLHSREGSLELSPGDLVANNYRVTERLGAGGMGTVYLAENVTLSQRVVVKVLRGGQAGAGQEEAQMLADLQHPNVVTVFAHDPKLDCIVMEFLDGASLASLLEKGVDRVNAIRIGIAIADALAAVHRRGLVHRDIKPENVMLALNAGGGRLVDWLKLIDFGLALKEGKQPEVLLGTPEYCAPEQFYTQEPAHPGNDVYSLGVVLFQMLTGTLPFDGTAQELPAMHVQRPPPSLLERVRLQPGLKLDARTVALLEDLDELVQQMMAKGVGQRPTAPDVARRLTRLENSFSEAGTFVGSMDGPISIADLPQVPRRRSAVAVLSRATKPPVPKGGTTSTTAPALQPVARTNVSTDELEAPRAAPAPKRPPRFDDATVENGRALPPPTSGEALPVAPAARAPVGLIVALSALIVVLAAALAFISAKPPEPPKPDPTQPDTPMVDGPATEPDAASVETATAAPETDASADASATTVTSDEPKPDAPDAAAVVKTDEPNTDAPDAAAVVKTDEPNTDAPDAAVATDEPKTGMPDASVTAKADPPKRAPPKRPKPVVVKPTPKPRGTPCVYDRDATLAKYQAAAVLLPDPEAFDAEIHAAMKAADCRRAEAVLQKMKAAAKAP
jgi:serine/threonine-protein kinase